MKAEINSLGSGSTRYAGPNALEIRNAANAPIAFTTYGDLEAMRILPNGSLNVGTVGVTSAKVAVVEQRFASGTPLYVAHNTEVNANTTDTDYGLFLSSRQNAKSGVSNNGGIISLYNEGYNTGAGSLTNVTGEWIAVGNSNTAVATTTVANAYGSRISIVKNNGIVTKGYALFIDDVAANTAWGVYQGGSTDLNYFAGNVGIGVDQPLYKLHVKGNSYFDGVVSGTEIRATYQDVAEWVPAVDDLTPGTVVVLNPDAANQVMASSTPYDTMVAGVVSAHPGLVLGTASETKEQVATTGRVKVRVDATRLPIRVGDLLVTSARPGTAMRSEPTEINSRLFHQPGTILGKALEPLSSGVGEILVLLSMQ